MWQQSISAILKTSWIVRKYRKSLTSSWDMTVDDCLLISLYLASACRYLCAICPLRFSLYYLHVFYLVPEFFLLPDLKSSEFLYGAQWGIFCFLCHMNTWFDLIWNHNNYEMQHLIIWWIDNNFKQNIH